MQEGTLALLLTPAAGAKSKTPPRVATVVDGVQDTARFERSGSAPTWYTVKLGPGRHGVTFRVQPREGGAWKGRAAVWMLAHQKLQGRELEVQLAGPAKGRPMPPRPFPPGVRARNVMIGETDIR